MSKNASILFVDDEKNVLEALRRLLVDEPYDVRTHTDPREALEDVKRDPPQVVVADYQMKPWNGPQFLHKVRDVHGGIVRMVLTGKPDLGGILRAVNEGEVHRFVLKPWDDDELRMILRNALDYSKLVRQRDRLLVEVDKHRRTIEALERRNPGLTKLPPRDNQGAYILTPEDCT